MANDLLLFFPSEPIDQKSQDASDVWVDRVGGLCILPLNASFPPHILKCDSCNQGLFLLTQFHAPLSSSSSLRIAPSKERWFYVFACNSKSCISQGAVKAVRVVKSSPIDLSNPASNATLSLNQTPGKSVNIKMTPETTFAAENWDSTFESTSSWEIDPISTTQPLVPAPSYPDIKTQPFNVANLEALLAQRNTNRGWESSDDEEAVPGFSELQISNHRSKKREAQNATHTTSTTLIYSNSSKLSGYEISADANTTLSHYGTTSANKTQNPPLDPNHNAFPPYYLEYGYDDPEVTNNHAHEMGLYDTYSTSSSTKEAEVAPEGYEKSTHAFYRSFFKKFHKDCSRNPSQILRHQRNGLPLFFAADSISSQILQGSVPKCEWCGSKRVFEFQIMPGILAILPTSETKASQATHDKTKKRIWDLDLGMEFGTVLVFTCERDCWHDGSAAEKAFSEGLVQGPRGQVRIVQEWCGVEIET